MARSVRSSSGYMNMWLPSRKRLKLATSAW